MSLTITFSNGMRQVQFSRTSKTVPRIVCNIREFGSQIVRTKTDCVDLSESTNRTDCESC
jgi:hypothetical protein